MSDKFYIPLVIQPWSSLQAEQTLDTIIINENTAGFVMVYDDLEKLQADYPGTAYLTIESRSINASAVNSEIIKYRNVKDRIEKVIGIGLADAIRPNLGGMVRDETRRAIQELLPDVIRTEIVKVARGELGDIIKSEMETTTRREMPKVMATELGRVIGPGLDKIIEVKERQAEEKYERVLDEVDENELAKAAARAKRKRGRK